MITGVSEVNDGRKSGLDTTASRARDGTGPEGRDVGSTDGVDLSLIRWMIGLTPTERLDALQGFVDSALSLRDGTDTP